MWRGLYDRLEFKQFRPRFCGAHSKWAAAGVEFREQALTSFPCSESRRRFAGYEQHDGQELLSFLLEAIHVAQGCQGAIDSEST